MAITGDPFIDYVKTQVNTRQNALGEGLSTADPRKLKTLKAYNTKTPWIRLASAVDITQGSDKIAGNSVYDTVKNLFEGFQGSWEGSALSKNFVLYGGVNDNLGNNPPSGIINSNPLTGAYGYGYNLTQAASNRGYIPPPGITNVEFDYKNDGALAYATVNVKAFSETQFQMIDVLFQRPGYTCLLEFGNSVYLDNKGELTYPDTYSTSPFEFLYNDSGKDTSYSAMSKLIQKEKEKWNGNYEGFFARITKFQWTLEPDGTYNILVNLVGMGDVISSLKTSIPKTTITATSFNSAQASKATSPSNDEVAKAEESNFPLVSEAIKSQLNFELYSIYKNTTFKSSPTGVSSNITLESIPINGEKYNRTFLNGVFKITPKDSESEAQNIYNPITYIKFGVFLSVLQKICNIKNKTGDHMINFNMVNNLYTSPNQTDNTYVVSYPGNFSANPNKCLISYTSFKSGITKIGLDTNFTLNQNIFSNTTEITDVYQPELAIRLSDIYINLNFITQCLKPLVTDNSTVSVLDLVNEILTGVNSSLGNQNYFRVIFDENDFVTKIVNETPIAGLKNPNVDVYTQLNTFGLSPNEGSFVTTMNLNSELSDDFATMITIGAQANANTDLVGATAFSVYNKGLVDRLFPDKTSPQENLGSEEDIESLDPISSIFDKNAQKAFVEVYQNLQFGDDYTSTLETLNENIANKVINKYTQLSQAPVPFFLPFNLSLTMDGLSGMKIYQAFQIQGRGLPPSYNPRQMSLIIKGLSHSVSLEGWTTKIETLARPESSISTASTGNFNPPSFASSIVTEPETEPVETPPEVDPEDLQLRLKVFRIMDDGDQTLGFYEVLSESGGLLYRLAVSELPDKGNQNSISCIPTGKYRVKSYQNSKYGKCFWYIGNEAGGYQFNALAGNGYTRSDVLIHRAPKAVGWLQGCQGPGFKFNVTDKQQGRQQGTGTEYLEPAIGQSVEALGKLVNSLWDVGSFEVTIENYFSDLPTSWEDERVQTLVKDLQLV